MTQEDKWVLLKDLCARFPYNTFIQVYYFGKEKKEELTSYNFHLFMQGEIDILPYLRPMSSMTDEEGKELEDQFHKIDSPCWVDTTYGCVTFAGDNDFIDAETAEVYTDWLNKHYFDYRGLIEKGLALEAPEGMYI